MKDAHKCVYICPKNGENSQKDREKESKGRGENKKRRGERETRHPRDLNDGEWVVREIERERERRATTDVAVAYVHSRRYSNRD